MVILQQHINIPSITKHNIILYGGDEMHGVMTSYWSIHVGWISGMDHGCQDVYVHVYISFPLMLDENEDTPPRRRNSSRPPSPRSKSRNGARSEVCITHLMLYVHYS